MVFGIFLLIFFPFLSSFSVYRGGVVVFRTTFRAHGLHTLQLIASPKEQAKLQSIYIDIHLDKQNNLKAMQYMI